MSPFNDGKDLENKSKKDSLIPSRNQIKKTGDFFRKNKTENNDDREKHYTTLFQYRRQHSSFLEKAQNFFNKKIKDIDKNSIIVARLKKIDTIINKLRYNEDMSLSNMNDIAGCRIVTKDLQSVKNLQKNLKENCSFLEFKKERNYLKTKDSGYRGVHFIYKAKQEKYFRLQLELQIRTELQNIWATAVEVVDFFEDKQLKRGLINNKWGNFFKQVSYLFEKKELGKTISKKEKENFKKQNKELMKKLKEFAAISIISDDLQKDKYYILKLEHKKNGLIVRIQTSENLESANDIYEELETDPSHNPKNRVVLISPLTIANLEKVYLNYFKGINDFLDKLKLYFGN